MIRNHMTVIWLRFLYDDTRAKRYFDMIQKQKIVQIAQKMTKIFLLKKMKEKMEEGRKISFPHFFDRFYPAG